MAQANLRMGPVHRLASHTAALLLAVGLAFGAMAATPGGDARAFAQRIVDRLNDRGPGWGVPNTAAWYDPAWLRLVRDNGSLANARGADALWVADPLCQCQDEGGRYRLVSVAPRPDGRVDARIRITSDSLTDTYSVILAPMSGGWRIWDIVGAGHSTRAFLVSHVTCLRAARTRRAIELCSVE